MSDIIERLRSYKGPWLVPAEAADEIEKLRGEVEALKFQQEEFHNVDDLVEIRKLKAERDAAVKMLGYVRFPAQRALGTVNWIRPADEPPPNVMVNWYTNADTLTELLKMTEGTP